MRKLFIFSFLANVALHLASLMMLPAKVAVHFSRGGIADSWAPKEVSAIIFLAIELPIFLALLKSHSWVFKFPPSMINLPHKDYWLKEENRPRAAELLGNFMWEFGVALFAFLFWGGLLVVDANLSRPVKLNEPLFLTGLAAFLLYTVYWLVKLSRGFRVPQGTETRAKES